jgi:hypothetical protein
MRRNFTRSLIMGAAAMAGLAGAGQVALANKSLAPTTSNTIEYKATTKTKQARQKIAINDMTGGLDFTPNWSELLMSPKEYGMTYGNGGSKRSNRLRYSHNAKVKRRKAA